MGESPLEMLARLQQEAPVSETDPAGQAANTTATPEAGATPQAVDLETLPEDIRQIVAAKLEEIQKKEKLQQADYTKKTMSLAEERKSLAAEKAQLAQLQAERDEALSLAQQWQTWYEAQIGVAAGYGSQPSTPKSQPQVDPRQVARDEVVSVLRAEQEARSFARQQGIEYDALIEAIAAYQPTTQAALDLVIKELKAASQPAASVPAGATPKSERTAPPKVEPIKPQREGGPSPLELYEARERQKR